MVDIPQLFHSGVLYSVVSLYFLLVSIYTILLLKKNKKVLRDFETFLKGFSIMSIFSLLFFSDTNLYHIGCVGLTISFLLFSFGVGKLLEDYTIKKKSK